MENSEFPCRYLQNICPVFHLDSLIFLKKCNSPICSLVFKAYVDLASQNISFLFPHRWAQKARWQRDILGGVLEDICFSCSSRSINFCPWSKLEQALGSSSPFCNCLGWAALALWPPLEQANGQEAAVPATVIALEKCKGHYLLPLSLSETSLQKNLGSPEKVMCLLLSDNENCATGRISLYCLCLRGLCSTLKLVCLTRQLAPIPYLGAILN